MASNLGVVELTIALESVFDVRKDKIVWDVGHQCYVHKILTGRRKELVSLRKFNGLSGFPNTNESVADAFNTGHSSTSLSAAMGLAKARDLKNKNYNVIAVIGDGALTGGMALEALNHIGSNKTKMIIILNDNNMSISVNNGGINKLLTNIRSKRKYIRTNLYSKKVISNIPIVGTPITKVISKGKAAVKQVFVPGMYFEEIGIKYLGPIDGHNIKKLEDIFKDVLDYDGPVLIHVLTKKGKGYKYAEENPTRFHGIGSFDIETGEALKKGKDYSFVFGKKLVSMAKRNKRIVAITAAMKDGVGLSEFADLYPDRFFDVGIAEQHALTFAAGLAKEGMIPFVSIYSSFYQRGYDQVIHDICLSNLHVIMCVDRAGLVGADGKTHQGLYDMAFFKIIPNITIMAPSDFLELEMMLDFAVTLNSPLVIRYPRGGEEGSFSHKDIRLGLGEVIRKGINVSIISIGKALFQAMEVADILSKSDIDAEVINARFLKPLDNKLLINSIKKTGNVIVIEDGSIMGGLSSSVKELIIDNKLMEINIKCYGYPDMFIEHGSSEELKKKYKLDNLRIVRDVKKMIKNK